jgi:hypothetical protein
VSIAPDGIQYTKKAIVCMLLMRRCLILLRDRELSDKNETGVKN